MRSATAFIVIGVLGWLGACGRGDPVDLSLKWSKGQVLRHRMVSESSHTPSDGRSASSFQRFVQIDRMTVTDIGADGTVRADCVIEYVLSERSNPDGTLVAFDSSSPSASTDLMARMLVGMVGKTTRMTMDRTGKILSQEGADQIAEAALDVLAKEPEGKAVANKFRGFVPSSAAFTHQGSQLPDHPVRVGDTWTHVMDADVPVMGKVHWESTYKLERVEGPPADRLAIISVTRARSPQKPPSGLTGESTETHMESEADELVFSLVRGQVLRSKNSSHGTSKSTFEVRKGQPRTYESTLRSLWLYELLPDLPEKR